MSMSKLCMTLEQRWSACRNPAEKHPRAAEAEKQWVSCVEYIPMTGEEMAAYRRVQCDVQRHLEGLQGVQSIQNVEGLQGTLR